MTIELKYKKGDIVYILVGFEIKKARVYGVYFADNPYQGNVKQYDLIYCDDNTDVKIRCANEEIVFKTPDELLEKFKKSIPTTNNYNNENG